tara:strand:- start:7848 stop:8180 length:333 start_codon:yes stop_codon:yes gene_type:complete
MENEMTSLDQLRDESNVYYIKFWADYCGWCTKMEGDWNQLKDKYHDTIVNGKRVKIYQISHENPLAKMFPQKYNYSIEGFPTILKLSGEKIESYERSRNFESLSAYVNEQ